MNVEVNYPIITNDRYRLNYHVTAPSGWMNDPNGFSFFKGYYHIFYQYHPNSVKWGPMHWGHARSKDLVHWERLPIALRPGDSEDKDGCFSGSAIVKDDRLYLIYTGHNLKNENNSDDYWQNQNLAVSEDGITFKKCEANPIIPEPPIDNAADFRDPKIWFDNNKWFVILGSKNNKGLGRVLLYSSTDLKKWDYIGPIATAKSIDTEGYVWECPDFFKINGQDILIMSPQGIKAKDLKYRNFYQTGYLIGKFDQVTNKFVHGEFHELDYGHDFYATQTMLAPDGRRLMFAWMDMWESEMPEQADGWAGALTFPRELHLKNNKLCMTPIREIDQLREKQLIDETKFESNDNILDIPIKSVEYKGKFNAQDDVEVKLLTADHDLLISIKYEATTNKFILHKYNDELAREAIVMPSKVTDIHLLLDKSSVEIFANEGEACFSERIYNEKKVYIETVSTSSDYSIEAYQLGHAI
jgi:beta-fructofuranosidase